MSNNKPAIEPNADSEAASEKKPAVQHENPFQPDSGETISEEELEKEQEFKEAQTERD